jgi:PPK2 family polyphosphate:nucleotide phosphotransferase
VLLVVQGMDTAGKGGILRHVVGLVDPQGVSITAFKAPTAEERRHPFLWRIRRALPEPGMIGVFDRSHYEDVLIVRVHDLVPPAQWARRYATINDFEQSLVQDEVTVVKVTLHISADEQKQRLLSRLDRPEKHWKFTTGDVDERAHWDDYQEAYQAVLERCSTPAAPWFVVPADRKWYARLAVQQLLLEHLRGLDLAWPLADFDVAEQRERLTAT